jgi:hypothetical protein
LAAALQFTMQAALQRWLGDLIQVQNLEVTSEDSSLKIDIQYTKRGARQSSTIQIARTV